MTESTDRQLLEKAAKAAGLTLTWNGDNPPYPRAKVGSQNLPWNPLTDDGDALRLAVKLGFYVNPGTCRESPIGSGTASAGRPYVGLTQCVGHDDDPYAATRRAIVRAAASIAEARSVGGGVEK